MTDVRLSITLDAEQAKRAAADFRAGYQALTQQLAQPVGQPAVLTEVQAGAKAASGEVRRFAGAVAGMGRAAGQQAPALSGLTMQQGRLGSSTRQLASDQAELAGAAKEAAAALKEQADAAASAEAEGGDGAGGAGMLGSALGAYVGAQTVATLAGLADGYKLMMARLRLATESQEEFNRAQGELERIAGASGSTMAAMVTLYGRISRPLKEAGSAQADILRLTEAVALSFRVSGASAAEAENGVIQFAQALGSGALRGDEFNSVAEQAPRLMQALAAGLGVPTSALRTMAEEGKLTAAAVTAALTGQLEVIKVEAEALPDTVEGAMTRLRDAVTKAFGAADTSGLVEAIDALRDKLGDPLVAQGFVDLAEALFGLAEMALDAARWFAELPSPIRNTALAVGILAVQLALVAPAATAASTGLSALWAKAVALIPSLGGLTASLATVGGALRATGVMALVGATVYLVAAAYDAREEYKKLTKELRDYEKALADAVARTAEYANVKIRPSDEVARMTETERRLYLESLRQAEEYHRKKAELIGRQGTASGPVDPAALAAARSARAYREALKDIGDAEAEREAAEGRHKQAVETIKADQLKAIQDALGKEIQAYNAANLELNKAADAAEAAMRRRVGVLEEFDRLIKDLSGGDQQVEPSVGAAMALKAGARQALQAGDTEEAIRQARAAGEMLRELQQAGTNTYGFKGMAEELRQIADAATQLDVDAAEKAKEAAQGQVDAIKARMDDLLAKAEAFKRLNVEFTGFEQSAAALEAQAKGLAERLKKYMVIPVNYIGADAEAAKQAAAASAQAGDLLKPPDPVKRATGGWIDGPGTPTSDSILLAASRGEYVLNARSAAMLGAANLDFMNRSGQLPARDHLIPQIPAMPSLDRMGERQPLNLAMPWGGSYALEGAPTEVARLQDDLRRTARKFGRTQA